MSWFRGASTLFSLNTGSKNIVIYGANGSGKSSFVDAFEYLITGGRIDHLSHEYSGSRQKDSLINTHIPTDTDASVNLSFSNGEKIDVKINADGTKTFTSFPDDFLNEIQSWKTENYILRQDEVAKFIHLPKGAKYSVLLPLLGLEELEKAADNFKRLYRRIQTDSKEEIVRNHLDRLNGTVSTFFSNSLDPAITEYITELCTQYKTSNSGNIKEDVYILLQITNERIMNLSPENTRYQLYRQCQNEQLSQKLTLYEKSKLEFTEIASDLIDKKIEVLQSTLKYLLEIKQEGEIECPACGQSIDSKNFQSHVESEIRELDEIRIKKQVFDNDRNAIRVSITQVLRLLSDEGLKTWMGENGHENIVSIIEGIIAKYDQSSPSDFKSEISELDSFFDSQLENSPPEIRQLMYQKNILMAIRTIPGISSLHEYHSRVKATHDLLKRCETLLLGKIKEKAQSKIQEINEKIQELWMKIHPDEPIENVKLYLPDSSETAIDISLKFFGVDQPSPRVH